MFGSSSAIFGNLNLRKSSKCTEIFLWHSNNTWTIFGNLRSTYYSECKKVLERGKLLEGKRLLKIYYIY